MFARALVIVGVALSLAGCFDYSDGNRVGTVVKFSRKGVFCKTWEGQMVLGGMKRQSNSNGGSSVVANTFDFTVENPAVVPQVTKALESGEPVRVTYRQELATFCRSDSDSNYFVTAVSSNVSAPEVPH